MSNLIEPPSLSEIKEAVELLKIDILTNDSELFRQMSVKESRPIRESISYYAENVDSCIGGILLGMLIMQRRRHDH